MAQRARSRLVCASTNRPDQSDRSLLARGCSFGLYSPFLAASAHACAGQLQGWESRPAVRNIAASGRTTATRAVIAMCALYRGAMSVAAHMCAVCEVCQGVVKLHFARCYFVT